MKKRKVKIFTMAASRQNGGSSSLIDLANAFVLIGHEVEFFTVLGLADFYIYGKKDVHKNIRLSNIDINIVSVNISLLKRIINLLLINTFKNFKLNKIRDSIIIDGIGINEKYLQKLKSNNNIAIFNHAGSPNAMIKYFLKNKFNNSYNYTDFINSYDNIFFQSLSQLKICQQLTNVDKAKLVNLPPSASEFEIKKHKNINFNPYFYSNDYFNVVMVGSIQKRKGQHNLINILERCSCPENFKFHIVGKCLDKEYLINLKNAIREKKFEKNIIIHGFKDNYLDFINHSDVVIQLSSEEGVSRVLRESMALGKSILSYRLDGTSDLLTDNEDCLLSDINDNKNITLNLEKLYFNSNLRNKISENAYLNFVKKYSQKSMRESLKNILKNLKPINE